ncbi:MAG: DNA breaking-rejoining protein [Candidatus Contendobacter sp.]|nr:DNA breaking-rejoining protein [Candidatus Contendobacter sp.]
MKKTVVLALTGIGFLAAPSWAEDAIRKELIRFTKGATQATLKARIKGDEDVDYTLRAKAGQTMTVTLKTSNPMNYFNVLPPDTDEALFVGQDGSGRFEGKLPKDGDYTIRVYLIRSAARRNESA